MKILKSALIFGIPKLLSKAITILLLAILFINCAPRNELNTSEIMETTTYDQQIKDILSKMSVAEKIGQMTQIDLNIIAKGGYSNFDGTLDPELLALAINQYKVGSILNVVNNAYDLEIWHKLLTQIQDAALKNENPIPILYWIDAIHGANYISGATLFPHNIGLGASRNPTLAYEIAQISALETRASGVRWNFDPVLDVGRNPLWSRFEETFGEDPVLISEMATKMVEGYQGKDLRSPQSVASTLKHFMGYSKPRSGRDRTPASMPEIELREYELPQYKKAILSGVKSVMINSGAVNGIPMHANKYMLTDVLRGELGFDGVIVSDWEDVNRLHERHNIAPTLKEAVRLAVLAGVDISMTPHDYKFADLLAELYNEDPEIAEKVDASVERILRLKMDLGLFDNPYPEPEAFQNFGRAEYKELALTSALQTITLLKNAGNALPVKSSDRILVAGPSANNITSLHGAWSFTWQGSREDVYPKSTLTLFDALQLELGEENVSTFSERNYYSDVNFDIALLAKYADRADKIVLAVGENAYAESPGAIQDLTLESRQLALIEAAIATGKPVILVLVQGRPRIIAQVADRVDAILTPYRPGSRGAEAIAKVLIGSHNPSGKLPFTYPRSTGDLVLYDHKWTELSVENDVNGYVDSGYNPQFDFGHGLSYSTFEYTEFQSEKETLSKGGNIKFSVIVTNTSDRSGIEVVELYSRHMFSPVVPSLRRLRAFQTVELKAGESRAVHFELSDADLFYAYYGESNGSYKWGMEKTEIHFMIGGLGFELEQPVERPRFVTRPFKNAIRISYE